MSFPTVCVAIPVKNGRDYLAEAIESVLAQEGVELSVCVLDNRSDDDSLEVARRYTSDARVTAELNPVDVFYYGSLNRILAGTQAEYFVPFAADDVMYSDNLARKVQALRDTGAGFVSSSSDLIDESGAKVGMQPDHAATPALVAAPSSSPGSRRATRCRASRSLRASTRCARSAASTGVRSTPATGSHGCAWRCAGRWRRSPSR